MTKDDEAVARAKRAARGSPFLSPEQAAHYLGVSVRTLQEHRSRGSGPPYRRHFRHVRYHIDDIDAWSTRHEAGEGGDD
ncbi:excisionase family DNA binding protein [Sphingomonas zeicaulis]|uniref:helix-turn-helix domain-containing protein n=1 Tax=Sphingomonas zeicaulis TaxID=1632740 RepID=UPI003D20ED0D